MTELDDIADEPREALERRLAMVRARRDAQGYASMLRGAIAVLGEHVDARCLSDIDHWEVKLKVATAWGQR